MKGSSSLNLHKVQQALLSGNPMKIQEAGDGRCDLQLVDYEKKNGIIFEFKVVKADCGSEGELMERLRRTAREAAISQVEDKHYDVGLKKAGMLHIDKYGAAFAKKCVAVEKE